jgi:hypothetical protein
MSGPYDNHARQQLNSKTQPQAKFWGSYNDIGGRTMSLNTGNINLFHNRNNGIAFNDIDVIYVPPNWKVRADGCGERRHCNPGERVGDFDGLGSQNGTTGIYYNFRMGNLGINDIDEIWVTQKDDVDETNPSATVPYTWDRFKLKCCTGAIEEGKCGIHVAGTSGNDCDEVVGTCLGSDLKGPYGSKPSYKTQYCTKYAKSNDSVGDLIKRTWCNNNPDDPWCSCMNLTKTPEYLKWQKLMTERYPEIPVSVLMYGGKDGTNPCRDNMDYDMSEIFIPSGVLASKGQLPRSYNISTLEISGDNNVLSNVNMSQNVTNNAPVIADSGTSALSNMLSFITKPAEALGSTYGLSADTVHKILILIAIVLFGTAGYYMFMDEDPPMVNPYPYPYPQPYPQPVR